MSSGSDSLLLDVSGLQKSYRAGADAPDTPVLQGVNLRLERGATAAIVGPSGCGKSTLLNIIGTLDRPDAGEILLNGRAITGLGDAELARVRTQEIGWIFQMHHLLPQCTVLENVLIPTLAAEAGGRREEAGKRAARLLERVGLSGRLSHRPGQLSGGERQRVAVVRALMNEPGLLLADEPTGALDRASAENLANLLVELNQEEGVALLVITHAPDLAARMQQQYRLSNGTLQPVSDSVHSQ